MLEDDLLPGKTVENLQDRSGFGGADRLAESYASGIQKKDPKIVFGSSQCFAELVSRYVFSES